MVTSLLNTILNRYEDCCFLNVVIKEPFLVSTKWMIPVLAFVLPIYFINDYNPIAVVAIVYAFNAALIIIRKLRYEEDPLVIPFVASSPDNKWNNLFIKGILVLVFIIVILNGEQLWEWFKNFNFQLDIYQYYIYGITAFLGVLNHVIPEVPSNAIYFYNGTLNFIQGFKRYTQDVSQFDSIRISEKMISMKGLNGKLDRVYGYNWSQKDLNAFKSFIHKKAPHIEVLVIDN